MEFEPLSPVFLNNYTSLPFSWDAAYNFEGLKTWEQLVLFSEDDEKKAGVQECKKYDFQMMKENQKFSFSGKRRGKTRAGKV